MTLVGADAVSVKSGIYMIMGANIGTSVTNTIVAMGRESIKCFVLMHLCIVL